METTAAQVQACDDNAYTEMDKFNAKVWTMDNGMPSKQENGTLCEQLIKNSKCFLSGTQRTHLNEYFYAWT